MNILIVFATKLGQTQRIADHAASRVREQGHHVTLRNTMNGIHDVDLKKFEAIMIASAVYKVDHQETITDFVINHREELLAKPAAFISVSLSVILPDGRQDADSYANQFMSKTQWYPNWTLLIGGALRLVERENMSPQVVEAILAEQQEIIGKIQDYDFTDWELLTRFTDDFIAAAAESTKAPQTA